MSQCSNRDQIIALTSVGSQRETHVERFISQYSQLTTSENSWSTLHPLFTVFNPVTHHPSYSPDLAPYDVHRSIWLVHQITEVSQEIIQKRAISIFSVSLNQSRFHISSLSSVSSSELFDFLSFCLPPSLLLCHLFCPLLWEGVRRENRTRVNHLLISGF